jgi:2-methylcitrate dehydratase
MPATKPSLTPDPELVDIARYACDYRISDRSAYHAARLCLLDALACALEALSHPECTKLLGPVVPGATMRYGARVPGTGFELDPATAAFNIATMVRWSDLSDTFTAAQGSHPSDNVGGILAGADYLSRRRMREGGDPVTVKTVLEGLIKAYEIQGCLAIENDFNAIRVDHVILPKVATSAVVTRMLGGSEGEVLNAVSNAWMESSLRVYRQAPCAGYRKGWSAGDAAAGGVRAALMAIKGEMGYPQVLRAKDWGFYDARRNGKAFTFQRPYETYVIHNSMFKPYAAGMHGQSAVECAIHMHAAVRERLTEIERVRIYSQRALIGIMDKSGPLRNEADRDHCVQYVVAVGLIFGHMNPADLEDDVAADSRIDALREKMEVIEDPDFTEGFYAPDKRSSANGLQIFFRNGTHTPRLDIEYPPGHPKRRGETVKLFQRKFEDALALRYAPKQRDAIRRLCTDQARLERTPVHELMGLLAV